MIYKTKLLKADKKEDVMEALALLKAGELVAVPTETVYGLAADAKNPEAVKKIFIAKGRPTTHPLIVHIASFQKITEWARDISPLAAVLAQTFWPGPLTLLLKKAASVNDVVTGGLATIAIRVPNNKTLLELLLALDTGLAAPSANPHKKISPTTAEHVMHGLAGKIAAVLDDGPCSVGLESTIIDLTGKVPKILRQGPITSKMLEDVLGTEVLVDKSHTGRVAGAMAVHYQPHTPALCMSSSEIERYCGLPQNSNKRFALMYYSSGVMQKNVVHQVQMSTDKGQYAKHMYQTLHELDMLGVDQILVEMPPQSWQWADVLDRLVKACATE